MNPVKFLLSAALVLGSMAGVSGIVAVAPAAAQDQPISIRSNFRLGDAGVRCTAQNAPGDRRLTTMFDRAWRLTCRDAAGAVGSALILRDAAAVPALPQGLGEGGTCAAPQAGTVDLVGDVRKITCQDPASGVAYRRYRLDAGGRTYLVEGLAGYDPALRLALASIYNDRRVPGTVEVAQTEVSDAAAFARVQAGSLNRFDVLDEAYTRNNSGRFAESSQFFENLAARQNMSGAAQAEALANQGLQQSNLGNFGAAARLFEQAQAALNASDGVSQRLIRNYRAIDQLNQRLPENAETILRERMAEIDGRVDNLAIRDGFIDNPLSSQINRENVALQRLGGVDLGLSAGERAELLDAQADAILGSAARQRGDLETARTLLRRADRRIARVREGRVASARWLRSEIAIERALIAEAQGRGADALRNYDRAAAAISRSYPQSPSLLAAFARKAGFLARTGQVDEARTVYADVVERSANVTDSGASLRDLLTPYFRLLAQDGSPDATADLFKATQMLQRPGVAQTQAILARQMSEGDDEASALFRLSLNRSREIARTQARADRLAALAEPNARQAEALDAARETLAYLRGEQTKLLARLGDFPRFRALAPGNLDLEALRTELRPGEAYYKMVVVGEELYALWITPDTALSYRIDAQLSDIDTDVSLIRDSIAVIEDGQTVTYPFDVETSRSLYLKLFGPIEDRLAAAEHVVFEPDGPMLQLPPQVLVASQEGADAYYARLQADEAADAYDYREVEWFGRARDVSIAVSPRGFIDIRNIPASSAENVYLGIGSNALPDAASVPDDRCAWPLSTWQDPIDPDELFFAAGRFGQGDSAVRTGGAFTDTALLANENLSDYRVLHFATHGLVTAPDPACPARPALVTSFGGEGSDGLLTFKEIFDLRLDADVVILSACDTAGMATVAASREAGVVGGGNYAMDGLVRAFVGAGARTVVASHWPVPDDFDATQRLIEGMISGQGKGLAGSLGNAQRGLMDDADTSHPFYWAAFIVFGDGAKPLTAVAAPQMASAR